MTAPPHPAPIHLVGVAVQFLTRLPVRVTAFEPGDVRRAMGAFPLVGLVVAAVGVAVRAAAGALWRPAPATILAVAAMVAVTGAFHEDGLADAADGLWGGQDPPRRIEIMRDPRLGTYGTLAVLAVVGLRVGLLVDLPLPDFSRAVATGHVLGRASTLAMVRLCAPLPGGSATQLAGGATPAGTAIAAAVVALTVGTALGAWAVVPLVVAAGVVVSAAALCARRLGGVNGDVLGAANQIVHVTSMAATVAVLDRAPW